MNKQYKIESKERIIDENEDCIMLYGVIKGYKKSEATVITCCEPTVVPWLPYNYHCPTCNKVYSWSDKDKEWKQQIN